LLPAKTPDAIIDRRYRKVKRIALTPEIGARFAAIGF
jgi:hypothetical protein